MRDPFEKERKRYRRHMDAPSSNPWEGDDVTEAIMVRDHMTELQRVTWKAGSDAMDAAIPDVVVISAEVHFAALQFARALKHWGGDAMTILAQMVEEVGSGNIRVTELDDLGTALAPMIAQKAQTLADAITERREMERTAVERKIEDHPASKWTHPVCAKCYEAMEPGRAPTVMNMAGFNLCCRCGIVTSDGIFYRRDPVEMGTCPENKVEQKGDS